MNLILLDKDDFHSPDSATTHHAPTLQHAHQVLKLQLGNRVRIGMINGLIGEAVVTMIRADALCLSEIHLHLTPPPKLPLTLLLALPRPKILRRLLKIVTEIGISDLILINSAKTDKSYWKSPCLESSIMMQYMRIGLEQSVDTVFPKVLTMSRFKPFVMDNLPELIKGKTAWMAHPGSEVLCPKSHDTAAVMAIGPEGGWVPFEIDLMKKIGFAQINLGPRILSVESAVVSAVTRVF